MSNFTDFIGGSGGGVGLGDHVLLAGETTSEITIAGKTYLKSGVISDDPQDYPDLEYVPALKLREPIDISDKALNTVTGTVKGVQYDPINEVYIGIYYNYNISNYGYTVVMDKDFNAFSTTAINFSSVGYELNEDDFCIDDEGHVWFVERQRQRIMRYQFNSAYTSTVFSESFSFSSISEASNFMAIAFCDGYIYLTSTTNVVYKYDKDMNYQSKSFDLGSLGYGTGWLGLTKKDDNTLIALNSAKIVEINLATDAITVKGDNPTPSSDKAGFMDGTLTFDQYVLNYSTLYQMGSLYVNARYNSLSELKTGGSENHFIAVDKDSTNIVRPHYKINDIFFEGNTLEDVVYYRNPSSLTGYNVAINKITFLNGKVYASRTSDTTYVYIINGRDDSADTRVQLDFGTITNPIVRDMATDGTHIFISYYTGSELKVLKYSSDLTTRIAEYTPKNSDGSNVTNTLFNLRNDSDNNLYAYFSGDGASYKLNSNLEKIEIVPKPLSGSYSSLYPIGDTFYFGDQDYYPCTPINYAGIAEYTRVDTFNGNLISYMRVE